ncbi:MAG TPA: tetratricopeptide repeat protein [Bryobacteraceae bacterium]|nr:tetratricopeptide repeat protein [Bryobacteraceae bacterium]
MPAHATKQAYSREEVRRLLDVSERQLRSWEKQKFVSASGSFNFSDMLALRTLIGLRKSKIPATQIRRALDALRARLRDVTNPLTELKIYSRGKKIQVQFAGQRMEPISGQLLLDFDEAEISKLLSFPGQNAGENVGARKHKSRVEAEHWFEKGLELEQTGAPMEEIIEAYRKASEIDPTSAGALVNLGTVYFNARNWREAEQHYRKALEVDSHYALAYFNLGNLFDEKGDRSEALAHYLSAIRFQSNYADAHYNVALLYQSTGQPLKAMGHWKLYLKLDPSSSWAAIARRELAKLKESTIVRGPRPG